MGKYRTLQDWATGCARKSPHAHQDAPPSPCAEAERSGNPARAPTGVRRLQSPAALLRRIYDSLPDSFASPKRGKSAEYARYGRAATTLRSKIRSSALSPLLSIATQ